MKNQYSKFRLSELGDIARGVTYKSPDDLRPAGTPRTVRLLRATNIQDGAITLDDVQVIDGACAPDRQKLSTGDIAICIANGSRSLVGKAALVDIPDPNGYVVGAFCARFRPNQGESSDLIAAILESREYRSWIDRLLGTTTINNLKPSDIADCPIVLPTTQLGRQRLGEILRTSRNMLRHTDALIAAKREQKRGLMQQLLTGKVRFPGFTEPWRTVPMKSLIALDSPGAWGDAPSAADPGVVVLRSTNMTDDGRINLGSTVNRIIEPRKRAALSVKSGDILLERSGGTDTRPVGRVAFARTDIDACYSNFLQRLRPNADVVNPRFLFLQLLQLHASGATNRLQAQTTGIRNLMYRAYLECPLPLPEHNEQGRICDALDAVSTEIELLASHRDAFAAQRRGLMERLLSGDIALSSSDTSAA